MALLSVLLGAGVAARSGAWQQPEAPAPAVTPADDGELERAGEETVERVCTECHGFEEITVVRRTPRDWKYVVTSMATKGAVATRDEFALVSQYLVRYYGRVPVNTATAEDLAAVLGVSTKAADAIVAYRTANGRFADIAALAKVPGIDQARLETQRDALRFD